MNVSFPVLRDPRSIAVMALALLAAIVAPAGVAHAIFIGDVNVEIIGSVSDAGGGQFDYSYEVVSSTGTLSGDSNDPVLEALGVSSFSIPLFDPADVAIVGGEGGLRAPIGWSGQVVGRTVDNWRYDPGDDPQSGTYGVDPLDFVAPPLVIEFSATDPLEYVFESRLNGFGFTSTFGAGNAPAYFELGVDQRGATDPFYPATPNSPHGAVPEPVTAGLAGIAVAAIGGYLRRRRG